MVVADGEAFGGILLDAAEALGDALPDRLQRLVPVPRKAAFIPTHSAEAWSTAMMTATWPCSTIAAKVAPRRCAQPG